MGAFRGLGEAEVFGSGKYFPCVDADYRVCVRKVSFIRTRKREDAYLIELDVIESGNPDMPVGAVGSHMIMMRHDSALGDVKAFLGAALGIDVNDKSISSAQWEEAAESSIGDDNPLAGTELSLRTMKKTVQKTGGDFTKHIYEPVG